MGEPANKPSRVGSNLGLCKLKAFFNPFTSRLIRTGLAEVTKAQPLKPINMKMTRILPTDKNGNVYYGPKTVDEAKSLILNNDADPAKVVADMRRGGYGRAANRIAREFIE